MTDGVVEARNADKEVFRNDRIFEIISKYNSDILENLNNELEEFSDLPQVDDISMLLISVW